MAAQPKPQSMAAFLDAQLLQGVTWEQLEKRCKAEAAKRGTATLSTLGQIKAHVKFRSKQAKWSVEITDVGVRMNAVAQPKAAARAKAQAKPKVAAKAKPAAPKNGRPTGRRTQAVVKEQRQTVEAAAAPEQTA